ncbi:MAG: single-stranded DNA-binding protein [Alphaproteobacteria bacterium]|nr:single-stranded DNA-binding protein [Alphaproteobacteria bacterium]
MLNKVILRGHIGRDPEVKMTKKGRQIATFFLATRFSWKDEDGEWQIHTDWHRITIFRESTIGWVKNILKKGDMVDVEGRLSYHCWADKFQQRRFTTHVVIEDGQGRVEYLPRASQEEGVSTQETIQKDTLQDLPLFLSSRRETGQEPPFHASQSYSSISQNLSQGENSQEDLK